MPAVTKNNVPEDRLRTRSVRLSVLFASSWMAMAPVVQAASAGTGFQVTAGVLKACLVSTPPTLAFGTYDPSASSLLTNTTSFAVTCTSGTAYSLGMSTGTGNGATVTSRSMTSSSADSASNALNYGLYKDSSYSSNWDNSTSASGYAGTGNAQPITVYGRIPANQYRVAPATDYSDTITMTLSY